MTHKKSILNHRRLGDKDVLNFNKHNMEFYLDFLDSFSESELKCSEEEITAYIKRAKKRFSEMLIELKIRDV